MGEQLPLLVLAIGGHGLSQGSDLSFSGERRRIARLQPMFTALAAQYRLLVVHGNGPQVGRLLVDDADVEDLDIHTAQSQGELGYLLNEAMPQPNAALVTRVRVADEAGPPVKPIGPDRRLVASPQPLEVIELEAIKALLATHHLVAGGGGGVPLTAAGAPSNVVVDKDWVALMLASELNAAHLLFATDIDAVYAHFDSDQAQSLSELTLDEARELLARGLDAGSMAPKVSSAAAFVERSGQEATICAVDDILAALDGDAGTRIRRVGRG